MNKFPSIIISIFTLIVLFSVNCNLFSQDEIPKINSVLKYEDTYQVNLFNYNKNPFAYFQNNLLKLDSIQRTNDESNANYYFSLVKPDTIESFILEIETSEYLIFNHFIEANDEILVIYNYNEIIVVLNYTNEEFSVYRYRTNDLFERARIINNNIYVLKSSIHGCDYCKSSNTIVVTFDTKTLKWKETLLPDPNAIEMTYFQPTNLLESDGSFFYVAEPLRYQIKIYNINGDLEDEISITDSLTSKAQYTDFSSSKFKELSRRFSNSPNNFIQELDSIHRNYFRLKSIDFINDTLLFASWTIPGKLNEREVYYYDLLVKKDNNWIVKKRFKNFRNENLDNTTLDFGNFVTIYNYFSFKNNKLILKSYAPLNLEEMIRTKVTVKEYKKLVDNYYKKNEVFLDLILFDMSKLLE